MEDKLVVIPHQLLVKQAELKLQVIGINQKLKELETIESKIRNKEYLSISNIKRTIGVKDFLDNLITIDTKEITSDTRNLDGSFDFKVIESIENGSYKPGDEIKFYILDREYYYLKPIGYSFKLRKKFFKKYNLDVEEEYNEYVSVCNYFYSLKNRLLYEYNSFGVIYFTMNNSKEVTRLIITGDKNGNK